MVHFLTISIVLGLSAGFAPGPLLMLVISETLQHGVKAGIRVALAPIFTDIPIILLTFLLMDRLAGYQAVLGVISLTGFLFLLYTAFEAVRTRPVELAAPVDSPQSLCKGVLTNLLSPHPYLFWISVGGPLLTNALTVGPPALCAFIAGFYLMLVGAKVLLAIAVGRSRRFLSGRLYLYTMRLLGILLGLFSLMLLRDGLKLLGFL